jgi:3D (Asp-Asp-Asp) domain-containing protein
MFAMVKAICMGLALISALSVTLMQPKDYLTAELSVAGDSSVTEVTQVTEIAKPKRKITVIATAYCPCEICCGKSDGITASGVKARTNHTIAVDRNVFPLGTHILYNGTEYVAEDTGGAIRGNRIDIYFDNHSEALEWGRRTIEIEVIV